MKIKYEYGMNLKSKFRVANMNNYGFPASILEVPYENDNFSRAFQFYDHLAPQKAISEVSNVQLRL